MLDKEDVRTVVRTGGGLAALDLVLKESMSFLRVKGAVGAGDASSFFEKLHTAQLLTANNVPTFLGLIALHSVAATARSSHGEDESATRPGEKIAKLSKAVRWAMWGALLSQACFVLRAFDSNVNAHGVNVHGRSGDGVFSPLGVIGASGLYTSQLVLIVKLFYP